MKVLDGPYILNKKRNVKDLRIACGQIHKVNIPTEQILLGFLFKQRQLHLLRRPSHQCNAPGAKFKGLF